MNPIIRPMTPADFAAAHALWQTAGGIGLSATDSRENFDRYLARNPGLSLVAQASRPATPEIAGQRPARQDGDLVGAVLCGHDGRRGYIHHLAVDPGYRRRGLGRSLVEQCLAGLAAAGIDKCHLFVFTGNPTAQVFWKSIGWELRDDLMTMSKKT